MHPRVRLLIAQALHHTRLTQPGVRHRDKLLIATFHRVLDEARRGAYPYPGLVVTPAELSDVLTYFRKRYTCGPLREVFERHRSGEKPKQPFLALTFDDGQLDNYEYALPVLKRLDVRATFFLPTDSIDRQVPLWHDRLAFAVQQVLEMDHGPRHLEALLHTHSIEVTDTCDAVLLATAAKELSNEDREEFVGSLEALAGGSAVPRWSGMMSWSQATRLAELGHELGSHSVSHAILTRCETGDRLRDELVRSKAMIEAKTGATVDSFCYPNGDHDERVARATAKAGYLRAVTTIGGCNDRQASPFTLRRLDMDAHRVVDTHGQVSDALLAFRLSGLAGDLTSV